jgi:hypothetical protein
MNPRQPQFTPEVATYVVERLINERRLGIGEVNRYLGEMTEEMTAIEARISHLRSIAGAAPREAAAKAPATNGGATQRRRTERAVSPEVLATRQLQGRYIRAIKLVPLSQREQYKKTAKEKGREQAIKEILAAFA